MKLSKTEYRGGEALVLTTRAVELVVTTSVGPRVVSFRSRSSPAGNLFLQFPADEERLHGCYLRGGHRLWVAPEHVVRTFQPDDDPLEVKLLANGVALTQPVEPVTGLQKGLKLELLGERTVKATHTLTNGGVWAADCAPWALTMFRPGGYVALPLLPKGRFEAGDLLPNCALVPWTYTDFSLPVWDWHSEFIGVNVGRARNPQKIGITNYPGWSAYWLEDTVFVKFAAVLPGASYPDFGCCFEAFTNGEMVETETLGPLVKLAPGKTSTHVEFWTVFDHQPKPNTDAVFAESLAPAVTTWLKKLK